MATLYLVATPIGNLEDITFRAVRVLKEVAVVACEDTRQTKKLLNHYEIKTKTISFHQHSGGRKADEIMAVLADGGNVAYVSDAGTPGISDPGEQLVKAVVEKFGDDVKIEPIPGPSAIAALASVSGLPTSSFVFYGFLPHKKGRQTLVREIIASDKTAFLYESSHRIGKLLAQLAEQGIGDRQIVIGRELTKKFETIYRGTVAEIQAQLTAAHERGEFTVAIAPR